MISDDDYDTLVELIYAAAVDPLKWRDVVNQSTRVFDAIGSSIFTPFSAKIGLEPIWSTDADPEFVAAYATKYAATDVLAAALWRRIPMPTAVYSWYDIIERNVMEPWDAYQEMLKPRGVYDGIGLMVEAEDHRAGQLMIYCPQWQDERISKVKQIFTRLGSHFSRAIRVHWHLSAARRSTDAATLTLDMFRSGVAWLSLDGELLYSNREMDRILGLRDEIGLANGKLQLASPAASEQLSRALELAATGRESAFAIDRTGGRVSLNVMVCGLPISASALRLPRAAAIAFVSEAAPTPGDNVKMARQIYGLTRAETELLAELAVGRDLAMAADRMGKSGATVRTQLRSLMSKFDVRRQADLIRLLGSMPQVRSEPRADKH